MALIAYLESDAVTNPRSVTSATVPEGAERIGRVTSTIAEGELFLHPKGHRGKPYRLR